MPRVSVLLPARNAEATLRPAMRSILRQSYRDLELVAVAARGARAEIRGDLFARGWVEGRDYLVCW